MAEHDTQALVDAIIEDAKPPQGSQYRQPARLLRLADKVLRTRIVPELLKVQAGHLSAVVEVPILAGKAKYRLPTRAIRLEAVERYDAAGRKTDLDGTTRQAASTLTRPGTPRVWFFESSSIVLSPTPEVSAGKLRISFARSPSRLVLPTECAVVTALSPAVNLSPGTGVPGGVQTKVDVVKATPGFESLADDYLIVMSGAVLINSTTLVQAGLEVGDYLAPAGTTPVPQIPVSYHALLVKEVTALVLRQMGDAEGSAAAREDAAEERAAAQPTASPRSDTPRVIVQRDW